MAKSRPIKVTNACPWLFRPAGSAVSQDASPPTGGGGEFTLTAIAFAPRSHFLGFGVGYGWFEGGRRGRVSLVAESWSARAQHHDVFIFCLSCGRLGLRAPGRALWMRVECLQRSRTRVLVPAPCPRPGLDLLTSFQLPGALSLRLSDQSETIIWENSLSEKQQGAKRGD